MQSFCYKPNGTEPSRQSLDIYTPIEPSSNPILVFVHGGAWISSSKSDFEHIGVYFQSKNIQTIIVDYRLTTKTNNLAYPSHTDDIVDAFEYIAEKFPLQRFVLLGHSCGCHLIGTAIKRSRIKPSKVIYCEGIFDIADLSRLYPTYGDWFLDSVFRTVDRKDWTGLSVCLDPGEYLVLHSKDDDLISMEHCNWFISRVHCKLIILHGSHDGVLKTQEFYDAVESACLQ